MKFEERRSYFACFNFAPGSELPARTTQKIQIDESSDFAITELSIAPDKQARIEDWRTILYNAELDVESDRMTHIPTMKLALFPARLVDIPSVPRLLGEEAHPILRFKAGEIVQLHIVMAPERPCRDRISAPLEITIGLHGWKVSKPKEEPEAAREADEAPADTARGPAAPETEPVAGEDPATQTK